MIRLVTLAWFGLEPWHLLLLGIVALLLYGKRLPEVGRSLGRGIAEFKKGLRDVQDELSRDEGEQEPPKPKLRAPKQDSEPSTGQKSGAEETKEQQGAGEQAGDE